MKLAHCELGTVFGRKQTRSFAKRLFHKGCFASSLSHPVPLRCLHSASSLGPLGPPKQPPLPPARVNRVWTPQKNPSLFLPFFLTTLPPRPALSTHQHLRTLLLTGNMLSTLPNELGTLASLNGLALSGNPLYYPPADVIQLGLPSIQAYLRDKLAQ